MQLLGVQCHSCLVVCVYKGGATGNGVAHLTGKAIWYLGCAKPLPACGEGRLCVAFVIVAETNTVALRRAPSLWFPGALLFGTHSPRFLRLPCLCCFQVLLATEQQAAHWVERVAM